MRARYRSIATLMGVILIMALSLAALSHPLEITGDLMLLATRATLMLATVGALCGGKTRRAWWVGFALFGWGYLWLTWPLNSERQLQTTIFLEHLMAKLGKPIPGAKYGDPSWSIALAFRQAGNCLWSLVFAVMGGALSQIFFAHQSPLPDTSEAGARAPGPAPVHRRRWIIALGSTGLVLALVILVGTMRYPPLFTGMTLLLTWGLIGVAALGALCNRGTTRVRYLGATLFGAGYLLLIFDPDPDERAWPHLAIDNSIRALWPALIPREQVNPPSSPEMAAANERIRRMLERFIPIEFPDATPLEDVLKYIRAATQGPNDEGLPIFVDVAGLELADRSLRSPVSVSLTGVPLKRGLYFLLKPIGLTCEINEGGLLITCETTDGRPYSEDPILPVSHCLLALFMAGLGSLVAPLVTTSDRPSFLASGIT